MSAVYNFEKWFIELQVDQQNEVLKHILYKYNTSLSEGIYSGPGVTQNRGLFGGPSASDQRTCPTCGR